MVDMSGWNQRKKKVWYYPDIEPARRSITHCAEVPIFTSLSDLTADEMQLETMDDTDSSDCSISSSSSMAAAASSHKAKPKPFSQDQLNDLVHDFGLSKKLSEILASRVGEHGILDSETKITFYDDRDDLLIRFFTVKDDFVYCNNIQGLLSEMGLPQYNPYEWRLFIDSSKQSLKCVLHDNGNKFSFVSIGYSVIFFCICIVHVYHPFTRKQIVSLYFGREVRTRLGVAISEMSGPPVFYIKARASR